MNISLAIKQSLRIENDTQYTNYQMNKSVKIQICPKISHNTSLWTDCTYGGLNFTKSHVASIMRHEKQTNMQNNYYLQAFSITAHYWGIAF